MLINSRCDNCKEPTKFTVGFYDGPKGRRGCLIDCKNVKCDIYQLKRIGESAAIEKRIQIQNLNSQNGMYAGYIAALRKDAKVTVIEMARVTGCGPAEYSSYEHERKEFDPEVYRKCEKYLNERRRKNHGLLG